MAGRKRQFQPQGGAAVVPRKRGGGGAPDDLSKAEEDQRSASRRISRRACRSQYSSSSTSHEEAPSPSRGLEDDGWQKVWVQVEEKEEGLLQGAAWISSQDGSFFKQRNMVIVALETRPGCGKGGGFELRVPEAEVKLVSTTELPPPYVPPKKATTGGRQKLQLTLDIDAQLSDIAQITRITAAISRRQAKRPLQLPRRDLCSAGGDLGLQLLCNAAWSSPPIPISRYYEEEEDDDEEEAEEMVGCYQKRATPSPYPHSTHGDSSADESWDRTSVESNSSHRGGGGERGGARDSRPVCRTTTLNRYLSPPSPTTDPLADHYNQLDHLDLDRYALPKDQSPPHPPTVKEAVPPPSSSSYPMISHKDGKAAWLFLPPTCPY